MTVRADTFIQLFNTVADALYARTGNKRPQTKTFWEEHPQFMYVVRAAEQQKLISAWTANQLADFADLRNAIVHHRDFPERAIAEPTEQTLQDFHLIVDIVLQPPVVYQYASRDMKRFQYDDQLIEALQHMHEHDYSQVVVTANGELNVLSTEGITRWLEDQALLNDVPALQAKVKDVIPHEPSGSVAFMARSQTVYEALEAFRRTPDSNRGRLFAILVTQNGKRTESALGIFDSLGSDDGRYGQRITMRSNGHELETGLPESYRHIFESLPTSEAGRGRFVG